MISNVGTGNSQLTTSVTKAVATTTDLTETGANSSTQNHADSGSGKGITATASEMSASMLPLIIPIKAANRFWMKKRDAVAQPGDAIQANTRSSVTQEYFSPADSAIYLGFRNRDSIYKLIDRNLLPYFKIAGRIRLKRSDLDEHIAKSRTAAKEAGDD